MKTSSTGKFKSIVGTIIMGLFLATMLCSIDLAPAIGKDNNKRLGKHDKGHYEYVQGKRVYRPYGYYGHRKRVYYPPPRVIYAPPPPPGISIFFPPFFFHR